MALPTSGQIDFGQIQTEFGGSNPISMNEYGDKIGLTVGTTSTHDIADFHGLSAMSSISLGSSNITYSGYENEAAAFDPNNAGKFVIAMGKKSPSYVGKAVLGTVSGTSISFGGAANFNDDNVDGVSIAFDPNTSNKFVVAYEDENTEGVAVVGTISGTSISFGTPVIFNSIWCEDTCIVFDPHNANKFVITYSTYITSPVPWIPGHWATVARVGTVSGTTCSFGDEVEIENQKNTNMALDFDPNTANRFAVILARSSALARAKVGTLSGTSISFGSEITLPHTSTSYDNQMSFDPNDSDKFITTWSSNPDGGFIVVGTISGTSISFGTIQNFTTDSCRNIDVEFNPNVKGEFVISFINDDYEGSVIPGSVSGTTCSFGDEVEFDDAWWADETWVIFDPNTSGKFVVTYASTGNVRARVGTLS